MEEGPFLKNTLFDPKYSSQNFEKLMTDLDSPSPITFGQTLWNIVLSSKIRFSDSKSGL
jgi:hypothetical protein